MKSKLFNWFSKGEREKRMQLSDVEHMLKHVNLIQDENGYHVGCKKHLWGVSAPTIEEVTREALHYFRQYREDGEYDDNNS